MMLIACAGAEGHTAEVVAPPLPRVEELVLDACYELDKLKLLKTGHKDHKEFNLKAGEGESRFRLSTP